MVKTVFGRSIAESGITFVAFAVEVEMVRFRIFIRIVTSFAGLLLTAYSVTGYAQLAAPVTLQRGVERGCYSHRADSLKGLYRPGTRGPVCQALGFGNAVRASVMFKDVAVEGRELNFEPGSKKDLTPAAEKHLENYEVSILNLIDQMATDFYTTQRKLENSNRDTNIPKDELAAWLKMVKVTAFQESMFTHYQFEGESHDDAARLKLMMGDAVRSKSGGIAYDRQGLPLYRSKGMFQLLTSAGAGREKTSYDLALNVKGGLEYLYYQWSRVLGRRELTPAMKSNFGSCRARIHSSKGVNWDNLIRSVYGMYNGGESRICRFAKSDAVYAEYKRVNPGCDVDKLYSGPGAAKKQAQCNAAIRARKTAALPWDNDVRVARIVANPPWLKWVKDADREKLKAANGRYEFRFDLACAMEGREFCLKGETAEQPPRDLSTLQNKLISISAQSNGAPYCVLNPAGKDKFICTHHEDYVPCLRNLQNFPLQTIKTGSKNAEQIRSAYYRVDSFPMAENDPSIHYSDDPRQLCMGLSDHVFVQGDMIVSLNNLNLRKAGDLKAEKIGSVPAGTVLQVLDFKITSAGGFHRWYRVAVEQADGKFLEGFVYGGNDINARTILRNAEGAEARNSAAVFLPRVGDVVEMMADQKSIDVVMPDSDAIYSVDIKKGQIFQVKSVDIVGEDQVLSINVENPNDTSIRATVEVGQLRTNALNASLASMIRQKVKVIPFTTSAGRGR